MLLGLLLACALSTAHAGQGPIRFDETTPQSGIAFVHTDGSTGQRYIMEQMTAGVALFEYDGDGLLDIYLPNGHPLDGSKPTEKHKSHLYHNDGRLKFTDVTDKAGVGYPGFGLRVCTGDYDNDGRPDIYVNCHGPNVLYHNNGDGTFTNVAKKAGVEIGDHVGAGCNFLDIDGDGFLDLFVANYVKWDRSMHMVRAMGGHPVYAGPRDYLPAPNGLFRNNRDGTFSDISKESGIAAHPGKGMGTVCLDYDNSGRTSILVANDEWPISLFRNNGNGKFDEVALVSGIAYDLEGAEHANMGICAGDFDNDGWLDVHVTAFAKEMATLYHNRGDGTFEDVSRSSGAGIGTLACVTWGNGLVDLDNDGRKDIFVASGHVDDNVADYDGTTSYKAKCVVLSNLGNGKFANVTDQCGEALQAKRCSRGAAFGDLDGDGKIDVVILNSRTAPTILRNVSPNQNHWLQIDLRGVKTNRSGVGARVKVVAGDLTQIDEPHSGQGFQSHYGMRLHFGLGQHDRIDRIEVRWIGGGVDVFENVRVDQLLTLTEGAGKPGGK